MKYYFALTAALFIFSCASAQIPKVGTDSLLEIGTWNTEWLGDTENGPTNEVVQLDNVKNILLQTSVDIWGLEEVSDAQTWNTLVANISSKYLGYIATYTQTQKTAVLYDKNKFQIIPSLTGHVLTESELSYDFGGRPPLCVALKTKNRPVVDTLYVFVIHMKAYGDKASYDRRVGASQKLKTYLDASYSTKRWVVCGDWNDDLYTSTYSNSPSPYLNLADTAKYIFISRELTDAGKRSYAKGSSGRMLDHILMSAGMKDWYIKKSARVLDELPAAISGYANSTSDHYPVIGLFDNRIKQPPADTPTTGLGSIPAGPVFITCFPNPASNHLFIQTEDAMQQVALYTLSGELVTSIPASQNELVLSLPDGVVKGIYVLRVTTSQGVGHAKILIGF